MQPKVWYLNNSSIQRKKEDETHHNSHFSADIDGHLEVLAVNTNLRSKQFTVQVKADAQLRVRRLYNSFKKRSISWEMRGAWSYVGENTTSSLAWLHKWICFSLLREIRFMQLSWTEGNKPAWHWKDGEADARLSFSCPALNIWLALLSVPSVCRFWKHKGKAFYGIGIMASTNSGWYFSFLNIWAVFKGLPAGLTATLHPENIAVSFTAPFLMSSAQEVHIDRHLNSDLIETKQNNQKEHKQGFNSAATTSQDINLVMQNLSYISGPRIPRKRDFLKERFCLSWWFSNVII